MSAEVQPPVGAAQVVAHLLGELHLLIQEVVFQEARGTRICVGRAQAVQALFQGQGGLRSLPGFTLLILRRLLHILEEFVAPVTVLAREETLGPLHYSSVNLQKWPTPSRVAPLFSQGSPTAHPGLELTG